MEENLTLCGGRKVIKRAPGDYRVVCPTCDGGGTVNHPTSDNASRAAIRDSAKPCPVRCGANEY